AASLRDECVRADRARAPVGRVDRAEQRGLSARADTYGVRRGRIAVRAARRHRAPPRPRSDRDRGRPARGRAGRDERSRSGRRGDAMTWRRTAGLAAASVACAAIFLAWNRVASGSTRRIPTARVQRGRVQVTVYTSGELRASRSIQVAAPPIGGNLQIVRLAASGEPVEADDIV